MKAPVLKIAGLQALLLAAGSFGAGLSAHVQAANDEPITANWAPTEWGAADLIGSVNRTTPAMVLAAVKLVKRGKVATGSPGNPVAIY